MRKINLLRSGKYRISMIITAMLIFVFCGAIQIFAQPQFHKNSPVALENKENQDSGEEKTEELSVVNDQALYLSQPVYPSKAKAANVKGEVRVEIVINKKGIVIKAKAVSGNALLRKAAEWAARRSKFRPSESDDETVLIRGIIVYTFQ